MGETYEIKKVPDNLFNNRRASTGGEFPLTKLKVGEMFEASASKKHSIYNAIKHRRNYSKELEGWVFTIKTLDKNKIACIRLK